jgi:hypothetical protein
MFQINWKWKAFLYKIFGILKLKIVFHFIQKHITKRSKVNIKQINKIWVYHSESIEKNNIKNILEIGAGKSLEQNIYISYRFNNSIAQTAIDINKMLDFELVNQASEQIAKILKQEKKRFVKSLKDLKDIYNIDYFAPCDLKKIKNKNREFDMSISTTALEHFTITDLHEYLDDLNIILKKGGFVSAGIDYSDHYSHTDRNISNLNYLSYSKQEWEKYNNTYLYQNRLRHQNYKEIFESDSYKIKDIILGEMLTPPKIISNEFDINNKDTFLGWAYFLIVKQNI